MCELLCFVVGWGDISCGDVKVSNIEMPEHLKLYYFGNFVILPVSSSP